MYYKYKCGNEIIEVWVWSDDRPELTVYDNKTNKSFKRSIREDEKGKFFMWNKNKIYLNDWIRISMKELKEKIDRNEFVISDDLCQAILSDGIDNVRFIVPLNVVSLRMFGITMYDNSEFKDTLCKIEEGWNREVRQNYKLTLVPVEPDETVERSREFYISDMIQLIQEGIIKIIL
jgi:hypothetical protein